MNPERDVRAFEEFDFAGAADEQAMRVTGVCPFESSLVWNEHAVEGSDEPAHLEFVDEVVVDGAHEAGDFFAC